MVLRAADKQQCLREMAFPCSGVAGNYQSLFTTNEIELGQIHDLGLVDPCLKDKVEISEKLAIRQLRFQYAALYSTIDQSRRLNSQQAFHQLGGRRLVLRCPRQFLVKGIMYSLQFQGFEMGLDLRQCVGRVCHRVPPPWPWE